MYSNTAREGGGGVYRHCLHDEIDILHLVIQLGLYFDLFFYHFAAAAGSHNKMRRKIA